jgi:hypothetical protein
VTGIERKAAVLLSGNVRRFKKNREGGTIVNSSQREKDEELLAIVQGWQKLEGNAISYAFDLMRKTRNPLTKMITNLIIHDSEKHKLVQQMIIYTLTEETLHLSPDELNELSGLINRHVTAEDEAIRLAEAALDNCGQVSTHFLLSYLIADKKKHYSLVARMDELKLASIPTSAGVRARHGGTVSKVSESPTALTS